MNLLTAEHDQRFLSATELTGKLIGRTASIGIVGLGYVGLPLTMLLADAGFTMTGFDVDTRKVAALNEGRSYIQRITSEEIAAMVNSGMRATADFSAIREMDAVIICVPTPLNEHREPDLSFIEETARAIAPYLQPGQLIVLESTTYPGTTEEVLIPLLERGSKLNCFRDHSQEELCFHVAYSPEREDPGNDLVARKDVPKVVGAPCTLSQQIASDLYSTIFTRTVKVSSTGAAEMTKLLENIYRCVNIALVNELKLLCQRINLDIWEIIAAAATKPFGFQPFYPGPGLGGHCIPIDPFYLSWKAREVDFSTRFIELAGEINTEMPYRVIDVVTRALNQQHKTVNGSKVLVLGLAYKKDIDDLRESPSLTLIELLRKLGAEVAYNDPYFPEVSQGRHYALNLASVSLDDISSYDCVLIATNHSSYDYAWIVEHAALVVDTRNATAGLARNNVWQA
ncbi:nucleotide sugar dehydrogenase [Terriglobus roseus]|uniref:UDP-N-acetyl-D-glucosamine dehydrogenase n=1 Tax=Terriglobus roseus TaxID=392734 RepID=A0A1H4SJE2_9BACT|nr:nucleotide sugar dehydrogenase [Terriglobus roseus]SEC43971.1 UDP-N-acetyl-D-glucosamine dehydrogenase [Terriglobus roseus]